MHNHQFIASFLCPNVPEQFINNFVDVINNNRLVSIVYDNDRHLTEGSP